MGWQHQNEMTDSILKKCSKGHNFVQTILFQRTCILKESITWVYKEGL